MSGCGSSATEFKGTSLVTITIGGSGKTASLAVRPATLVTRAGLQLSRVWYTGKAIAAGITPPEVKGIRITVTASDMATINRNVQVLGQQDISDTFEVPNGPARLFTIDALNSGGIPIYSSSATRDLSGSAVEVSFDMKPINYTVTATVGPNGTITPSGESTVSSGQTLSYTITPNSGYNIANVSGCNGNLSGSTYTTGVITGACTVTAGFSPAPPVTYIVSTSFPTGFGSISPADRIVTSGSTATFTVTPNTGYSIATVSGCGGSPSGNNYTTGAITSDCTVTASFIPTPLNTVSGAITDASGIGISGVGFSITGTGFTLTLPDANGNYSLSAVATGEFTITPTRTGYTFSPPSRSIIVNGTNHPGQNFIGTRVATPINGACGTSNGATFSSIPTTNLCTTGVASPVAGGGPWAWTCSGTNGGTAASCSAFLILF
jgi:hypothetical protein